MRLRDHVWNAQHLCRRCGVSYAEYWDRKAPAWCRSKIKPRRGRLIQSVPSAVAFITHLLKGEES